MEHQNHIPDVAAPKIKGICPCFTPGTLIATPRGEVRVEELSVGDKVVTRDNGFQDIVWTGSRKISWAEIGNEPHLKPVMITQGSLGRGLPEFDLMVSQNHRILVTNDRTALRFNELEVLVAAKHLLTGRTIYEVNSGGTVYHHLMFSRHQVVLSNGAWTESFQPSDFALKGIGNAQRNEIFEIMPDLRGADGGVYDPARLVPTKTDMAMTKD